MLTAISQSKTSSGVSIKNEAFSRYKNAVRVLEEITNFKNAIEFYDMACCNDKLKEVECLSKTFLRVQYYFYRIKDGIQLLMTIYDIINDVSPGRLTVFTELNVLRKLESAHPNFDPRHDQNESANFSSSQKSVSNGRSNSNSDRDSLSDGSDENKRLNNHAAGYKPSGFKAYSRSSYSDKNNPVFKNISFENKDEYSDVDSYDRIVDGNAYSHDNHGVKDTFKETYIQLENDNSQVSYTEVLKNDKKIVDGSLIASFIVSGKNAKQEVDFAKTHTRSVINRVEKPRSRNDTGTNERDGYIKKLDVKNKYSDIKQQKRDEQRIYDNRNEQLNNRGGYDNMHVGNLVNNKCKNIRTSVNNKINFESLNRSKTEKDVFGKKGLERPIENNSGLRGDEQRGGNQRYDMRNDAMYTNKDGHRQNDGKQYVNRYNGIYR